MELHYKDVCMILFYLLAVNQLCQSRGFSGSFYLLLFCHTSLSSMFFPTFFSMLLWSRHLCWSSSSLVCYCGWFSNVGIAFRGRTYSSMPVFVTSCSSSSTIISVIANLTTMNHTNGDIMLAVNDIIPWFNFLVCRVS